jgi:ANTAR domain
VRSVVVVGDQLHDERGRIVGTQGFYIDTTPDEREQQDLLTAQLAAISENRAVIEQAKGVLMATYGITANRAFEILTWRSQETNLKVRELALRFMAAVSGSHFSPESRSHVDHTLLTLRFE